MKTNNLSLVSFSLILIVAVLLGFYLTRPILFSQHKVMPVFYGEEMAIGTKADKAINVAQSVKTGQVALANEAIKTPVTASTPLPIFPPQITFKVLPIYPVSALEQSLSGKTILAVVIGAAGQPSQVTVKTSSGVAELDNSAVAAVSQWKFSPASQGGAVVASCLEIPVRFEVN